MSKNRRRPPIPEDIWRSLLRFLERGGTGRIFVDAKEGRVIGATFPPPDEKAGVLESTRK